MPSTVDITPMACKLKDDEVLVNHDLRISFRRTIRVPDNDKMSNLPPDLGKYPLKSVSKYINKIPAAMTAKGGLFFPMYQSEAMWIDFECYTDRGYMIKVYVGTVNAVSGEPAVEDAGTKLRRQEKLAKHSKAHASGQPFQDYIIVPGQRWLDGIAEASGKVRQFVAMPFGSGYSVESQVTGHDAAGGIQFEVTPYEPRPPAPEESFEPYKGKTYKIYLKTLTCKTVDLQVWHEMPIRHLKKEIRETEGVPLDQQRLILAGRQLEDQKTIGEYGIREESTIHMVLTLRGGGYMKSNTEPQMNMAAGGRIRQSIVEDRLGDAWQSGRTTVFNVQILNSAVYRQVTEEEPPTMPIDAKTYHKHGFPFFKLYEEPSGISGDFSMVKSIGQIDDTKDGIVTPRAIQIGTPPAHTPVGLVNPNGPLREFRTA